MAGSAVFGLNAQLWQRSASLRMHSNLFGHNLEFITRSHRLNNDGLCRQGMNRRRNFKGDHFQGMLIRCITFLCVLHHIRFNIIVKAALTFEALMIEVGLKFLNAVCFGSRILTLMFIEFIDFYTNTADPLLGPLPFNKFIHHKQKE